MFRGAAGPRAGVRACGSGRVPSGGGAARVRELPRRSPSGGTAPGPLPGGSARPGGRDRTPRGAPGRTLRGPHSPPAPTALRAALSPAGERAAGTPSAEDALPPWLFPAPAAGRHVVPFLRCGLEAGGGRVPGPRPRRAGVRSHCRPGASAGGGGRGRGWGSAVSRRRQLRFSAGAGLGRAPLSQAPPVWSPPACPSPGRSGELAVGSRTRYSS